MFCFKADTLARWMGEVNLLDAIVLAGEDEDSTRWKYVGLHCQGYLHSQKLETSFIMRKQTHKFWEIE